MKWVETEKQNPAVMRDVLMYFADRDLFCIGWFDEDSDWFIWKGMDDSTQIDGPPEYWAELEVPRG